LDASLHVPGGRCQL